MKMLWKLTKEAARYKVLYILAILSTLLLTGVNLAAPKLLSRMTGIVGGGVDDAALKQIYDAPSLERWELGWGLRLGRS